MLSARNDLGFPTADLESAFLETYSEMPRFYLNGGERAPADYGTKRYFATIDARSRAELPDMQAYMNAPDHPNPVLVSMYPFAYYALDAAWMRLVWAADPSLVAVFFAARLFSVALLAGTLTLTYFIAREAGLRAPPALLFVAVVGTFALTTFVASYVQPDNLAALAVTLLAFTSLRMRRSAHPALYLGAAVALGTICVTKYQTALCCGLAFLPFVAVTNVRRLGALRSLALAAACTVPAAALLAVQALAVGKNDKFAASLSTHLAGVTGEPTVAGDAAKFGFEIINGIIYTFIGNVTPPLTHDFRYASALSYWNYFGNLDTYVVLVDPAVDRVARTLIPAFTIVIGALTVVWIAQTLWRLARLAARRRRLRALELLVANVPLNAYLFFLVFMVTFYALTDNNWRMSGRNYISFVVPALLLGIAYVPRVFRRPKVGRWFGGTVFAALTLYGAIGSFSAASAIEQRYYGPPALPALGTLRRTAATDVMIDHVAGVDVGSERAPVPAVALGTPLEIAGVASDFAHRSAAGGVVAVVDGRERFMASYGYSHEDVSTRLRNPELFWAGFHVSIPTGAFAVGRHLVRFEVVSKDLKTYGESGHVVRFDVVAPAPRRPIPLNEANALVGSLDMVVPAEDWLHYGTEPDPVYLSSADAVYVRGWLEDVATRRPFAKAFITIDRRYVFPIHLGDVRPELAADFPAIDPAVASFAGFTAVVRLKALPPGGHSADFTFVDALGKRHDVVRGFPIGVFADRPGDAAVEPPPLRLPYAFDDDAARLRGSIDAVSSLTDATEGSVQPIWLTKGTPLFVRGWALRFRHGASAPAIVASIDGMRAAPVTFGDLRPDVARGLRDVPFDAAVGSGYHLALPTTNLAPGLHRLTLVLQDPARPHVLGSIPFTIY